VSIVPALLPGSLLGVVAQASVPALIVQAGLFAKLVLAALTLMSIVSWAVIWDRARLLRRTTRADEAFLRAFRQARTLGEGRLLAAQHPQSVLARMAVTGLDGIGRAGGAGMEATDGAPIELAARAMQRDRVEEMDRLERHVSMLATIGSVAPFLGLMGTVWGVMDAFLNIGVQGSASLIVVAPGIAEALIATLFGLGAAIPAVIGYNTLVSRARTIDNRAAAFVTEFADAVWRQENPAAAEPRRREAGA
jgi:biopolymer transport protein TolQ